MSRLLTLLAVALFFSCGVVNAADEYLGSWGAGSKELLTISREGDTFKAEFIRKNVKSEYEKIGFPAKIVDGVFVISFDLGNVSATYDSSQELLMLGGVKEFKKLSREQAALQLKSLQHKVKTN